MTREELVESAARALADEPGDVARNVARAVLAVAVPAVLEEAAREVDRCADAQAALLGEDHGVTVVSRGMADVVRAVAERLTGG